MSSFQIILNLGMRGGGHKNKIFQKFRLVRSINPAPLFGFFPQNFPVLFSNASPYLVSLLICMHKRNLTDHFYYVHTPLQICFI